MPAGVSGNGILAFPDFKLGASEGFRGVREGFGRGSDVRSRGRGSTNSIRAIICVIISKVSIIVHHRVRQIYDPA
eukprot:53519-Prorocentrum_minimum.AAC.1